MKDLFLQSVTIKNPSITEAKLFHKMLNISIFLIKHENETTKPKKQSRQAHITQTYDPVTKRLTTTMNSVN